jgi:glycosyltransferase involved in cell wall biosynthesis
MNLDTSTRTTAGDDSRGGTRPTGGAVHGVLVTYRRPEALPETLRRVTGQTRPPDTLVVVDNDPDASARASVEATGRTGCATAVSYVAAGANLGPAGGIALGMRQVLAGAADDDWILVLDDDDPPPSLDLVADLVRFGDGLRADRPDLGGVGTCGARFQPARARSVRVPDDELAGAVPADWMGSGQFPLYSVRAVRTVGVFDEALFFGFDDLEFGLRLSAAGFPIYAHGELWRTSRAALGRLDFDASPSRDLGEPTWRRYYSLRNLVYILRKQGHDRAAARLVARSAGKVLYNLPRQPRLAARHLALNARAVTDAYRGRMGLTVPPSPTDQEPAA